MKKISHLIICVLLLFLNVKEVKIDNNYFVKSYIVIEKETKKVLEGKDYCETQSVASISKLMTFYVAYKYSDLDSVVIVGEEIKTIVGSAVYLVEDEQITMYELLVALLLRSANDAAVVTITRANIPKTIAKVFFLLSIILTPSLYFYYNINIT